MPAAQARLTYQMGVRLLRDLTRALALRVDPHCPARVTEADLPAIAAAIQVAGLSLTLEQAGTAEMLRLTREYEIYLVALSRWLMFPLAGWLPPKPAEQAAR